MLLKPMLAQEVGGPGLVQAVAPCSSWVWSPCRYTDSLDMCRYRCVDICRYEWTCLHLDPVDEVDVAHLLVAGQPLHHLAGPSVEHGAPHLCVDIYRYIYRVDQKKG